MREFLIGAVLGFGIWMLLRGLFPPRPTLHDQLSEYRREAELDGTVRDGASGLRERVAMSVLRAVRGEVIDQIEADAAVVGVPIESHAVDKLNAAIGGAVLTAVIPMMFGYVSSVFAATFLALAGAFGWYFAPDADLKKKAAARRAEFTEALTGFVALAAVSISGGGGINTALEDAATIGSGWVFETIRETLADAALHGDSPWFALDELGKRTQIEPLIELAGALGLAGASGARLTDTLRSRAESGRRKEVANAEQMAEKATATLGTPIGIMLFGMTLFLGYPALAELISS